MAMNVLLVSGEYPSEGAGGIGTVARELADRFDREGIGHRIVCTHDVDAEDDRVVPLAARGTALLSILDFGRSFRRYVRDRTDEWDVYHFHLPGALGPLLFCPREILPNAVVTFHTTSVGFSQYLYPAAAYADLDVRGKFHKFGYARLLAALERRVVRHRCSEVTITTVSSGVAREVEGHYGQSVRAVVENGIASDRVTAPENGDPEERAPAADAPRRLLTVGRLDPQKGFCDGLEALATVEEPFDLTMVGTGPLAGKLKAKCETLGVDAEFPGYVPDDRLWQYYEASDLLLMPSRYEGLPMVGLEAASHGLPIVGFQRSRVSDVVCEENDRYLVPNGETRTLGERVSELLARPDELRRIGQRNRRRVRTRFTAERMADGYLSTYEEVAE